jgi:predicted HicB family RNase H-like nuclease
MDTLDYNGYRGSVHFSADDRVFYGEILGIDDLVSFEGGAVEELERAFREAVDDYLALCKKIGKKPERAYSGNIPLRIADSLHRRVAIAADSEGKSLNGWIADALDAVTSGRAVASGRAMAESESPPGGVRRARNVSKRRAVKRRGAKKRARKRA